ncbi:hypothetical protein EAO76_22810 [Streptomyces sp. sk2.1]|nr:hypothetical protein EAO76_22810 [Streptomyces sp. sk2.1]
MAVGAGISFGLGRVLGQDALRTLLRGRCRRGRVQLPYRPGGVRRKTIRRGGTGRTSSEPCSGTPSPQRRPQSRTRRRLP